MMKKISTFLTVILITAGFAVAQPSKDYKWEVNVPIPDNDPAGVSNTQIVPDSGLIRDVNVDLFIEHTWQGDLVIDITHGGVTVPLLYRPGDSTSTGFGFSADNLGTPNTKFILDDEAMGFYDSAPPNGIGNIPDPGFPGGISPTGQNTWQPYGLGGPSLLSAFDGLDKQGPWILTVSDNAGGDLGSIINWSLHIQNVPEPASFMLLGLSGLAFLGRRLRQA